MNSDTVSWYKASDGTAAVDMQVALVTQWFRCGARDRPSFQTKTPAGPVGSYSLEFSDEDMRKLETTTPDMVNAFPTAAMAAAPTQPSGGAIVTTMISVDSIGEWFRGRWDPTVGQEATGEGHLPTKTKVAYTEQVDD